MIVQELAARFGLEIDSAAFARVDLALRGLQGGLVGLVGLTGALAVGLAGAIGKTAQMGDEVYRTAQRTGTTTDALQELEFAAQQTGTATETLDMGLVRLSRAAFEASHGSQEARQTFMLLGVSLRDAHGNLKPSNDLLSQIANKFSKMPDGMAKTALAMRVFGRSDAELIPLLNKGEQGLAQLADKAHDFGVVMGGETIEQARQFQIGMRTLGASLRGVMYAIAGPLLPEMTKFVNLIAAWVKNHRQLIAQKVHQFFTALVTAVTSVARGVELLIKWLFLLKPILGTWLLYQGWELVGMLAALTAGELEWGAAALIAGARAAAGWVIAVAPVAALIATLGVLYLILEDVYYFFTGGKSFLGDVWTKWINSIANPPKGEWWFIRDLKLALGMLTDIQGTFEKLKNHEEKRQAEVAQDPQLGTGFLGTLKNWMTGTKYDWSKSPQAQEGMFGPPSVSSSSSSRTHVSVHAPVHVTVPPGTSPTEIGKTIAEHIDARIQSHLNATNDTIPAVSP